MNEMCDCVCYFNLRLVFHFFKNMGNKSSKKTSMQVENVESSPNYLKLEDDSWNPFIFCKSNVNLILNHDVRELKLNLPKDINNVIYKYICQPKIPPMLQFFENYFEKDVKRYKYLGIFRLAGESVP